VYLSLPESIKMVFELINMLIFSNFSEGRGASGTVKCSSASCTNKR